MANSYTNPITTSGLTTYKANQMGALQPLVSDLLTQQAAPNSYVKPLMQGDSTAIKNRLAEYNQYDASKMGGLANYFAQAADARNKNKLYMKPTEFNSLQNNLSGIGAGVMGNMSPLLTGLNAVGNMGDNTYYDRTALTNQLNKFSTADLSPYQNFNSVKGVKPVTSFDGKTFYNKSDLEALSQAKNYWADVDPDFAAILGSAYGQDDGGKYIKGLIDPTKFQKGLGAYGQQDIGGGKYNILGADGSNLGVGYDPVSQAIAEYGGRPGSYAGGPVSDWEVLGQLVNGKGQAGNQEWGTLPINHANETMAGANTLYGSTPVFYNGKLIGYKADFGTGAETYDRGGNDSFKSNPFGYQASHKGKSHNWTTGVGRDIDPNSYAGLVQGLGGTNYFVPVSNVDKLPGWTNTENYQHADVKKGWLQQIWENTSPTSLILHQDFADMQPIGAAVGNFFIPGLGSALNALDSYSKGDAKGGNKWLGSAALSYGGANMPGADGSSLFGTGVDLGSTMANQAAQAAIMGGVGTGIMGGSLKDVLMSAAMGGIGSAAGNVVGGAMQGSSPLAQAFAKAGLNTGLGALRGGSRGALSGLISSGLGMLGNAGGQYANSQGYGNAYNTAMTIANPVIQQLLRKRLYK